MSVNKCNFSGNFSPRNKKNPEGFSKGRDLNASVMNANFSALITAPNEMLNVFVSSDYTLFFCS